MLLESIEMEWMTVGTGDAESAAISTGDLQRLSNKIWKYLHSIFNRT